MLATILMFLVCTVIFGAIGLLSSLTWGIFKFVLRILSVIVFPVLFLLMVFAGVALYSVVPVLIIAFLVWCVSKLFSNARA
ncbi:MAG: hypothetical protein K5682_04105 [Lachnospiraceae bacterium]|nr:hypothetical protein [Lachnospiraceae bacterium]